MSEPVGVRRASCPCGEPNPPELGACTRARPCPYALSHPGLWSHFGDVIFDAGALITQLKAITTLPADQKRLAGEVLVEYGQEMVQSAGRLERLQELLQR